ncbi:MAG: hypothetical protein LBS51_05105 [Oscillospiraceae bacterium]|jgi:hypothetical protein|nr:hypothetical protein [Oscillospiraceae bacterium]
MTGRSKRSLPRLAAILLLAAAALGGCGGVDISAAITEYADAKIVISGLAAEEFTVTPEEMAKLDSASARASGQSAKAGTVRGFGPSLETFLAQYGKSPEDFSLVRFIAADGYRVTLHEKSLAGREIIMAITGGEGALPQSERPMRLIIPEAESSQWIYAVERIEFELR